MLLDVYASMGDYQVNAYFIECIGFLCMYLCVRRCKLYTIYPKLPLKVLHRYVYNRTSTVTFYV